MSDLQEQQQQPQPLEMEMSPRPEDEPMHYDDDNNSDDEKSSKKMPMKGNEKFEKLEERIRMDKYDTEAWTVNNLCEKKIII